MDELISSLLGSIVDNFNEIKETFMLVPNIIKTLISFIPYPFNGIIALWFGITFVVIIFKFSRGDS